jgi:hypothetical protein
VIATDEHQAPEFSDGTDLAGKVVSNLEFV